MKLITHNVLDSFHRPLRDLRISVTDRCNFRCTYCMPKAVFGANHPFLARNQILSFEQIQRCVQIFSTLGVRKIRLTGGEPLVRKDLELLIAKIKSVQAIEDISLTTNAALLTKQKAQKLFDNGLGRITISLDAIDDHVFKQINDVNFSVNRVLRAIDNAIDVGFNPIKINMVVMKNVNHEQILPMVEYFKDKNVILRFIEFMDVGTTNKWQQSKVFAASEIIRLISQNHPLSAIPANYKGEVANRWKFDDQSTEIGIISSVSQPFCQHCHRIRISAQGKLYTCLFANQGYDLRNELINNTDEQIQKTIRTLWQSRNDQYSLKRQQLKKTRQKIEMSYIGG